MYEIINPEKFRLNVREKLEVIIPDSFLAENLEKGIFNYAIKEAQSKKTIKKWENPHFAQIYVDRLRSIYVNLKNPELVISVINGEILPQVLAFSTHQEMKPDMWRSLIDKKVKRDASKYTNNIQASTDMFTCNKCNSKKCYYYELQTRSADEPMTVFITCLDCGKQWRQ